MLSSSARPSLQQRLTQQRSFSQIYPAQLYMQPICYAALPVAIYPLSPYLSSPYYSSPYSLRAPITEPISLLLPVYDASGQLQYQSFVLQPVGMEQPVNQVQETSPTRASAPTSDSAPPLVSTWATEKKLARKQAQKFMKKLRKQQSTGLIQESLAERVVKSEVYQDHLKKTSIRNGGCFARSLGSPFYAGMKDYSQYNVVAKINAFLQKNYCGRTTSPFYCNGITMLWLLMMSWNLEPLFYQMVKEIADCPFDQLHTVYKTILEFLEWIDIGQNPGKYSKSTLTQDDMHKIIGNIEGMTAIKKHFSQDRAADLMDKLATKNTILALGGYRDPTGRATGHTIGLFYRNRQYYLFDPDYRSGKPKIFSSARFAALEARYRLFAVSGKQLDDTNRWEFYVSHRPARPTANDSELSQKNEVRSASSKA